MKFALTQITAAIFAVSSASAAYLQPRQDAASGNDQQVIAQYPEGTNAGALNGTWYLTGITENAWKMYETLTSTLNLNVSCISLTFNGTSNTTADVHASGFLGRNGSELGVNATAAGAVYLQSPDASTNTSNHELYWNAFASQIFVNKAQWENFTSNGQSNANASESGSAVIPGSKPMQAYIHTQLIDSGAQSGDNSSTNYDTVFVWATDAKTFDTNQYRKRDDDIYGVILTKNINIADDTFNKTLSLLPPAVAQNNITIVKLNDTCSNDNNNNNNQ